MKNVIEREKTIISNNPFIAIIALVLITIPLPYIFNSIATIFLATYTLFFTIKNKAYRTAFSNKTLLFPIILYILMVFSLLWTKDFALSQSALIKELPFLIIPVCFLFVPIQKTEEKNKILQYYSWAFFGYTIFYLLKAAIRYVITKDSEVFFYHELVTFDVNAIHVSVYVSLSFFIFYIKKEKTIIDSMALFLQFVLLVLLSSKNILFVFFILLLVYSLFFSKRQIKMKTILWVFFTLILLGIGLFERISQRYLEEIVSNGHEKTINERIGSDGKDGVVYNVSIKEAWEKEKFQQNDYFPGAALRVYQIRIFLEMLQEDPIFFNGYGLNASGHKITEKRKQHNLYPGYENFNFHNQYIQFFAEIGVIGLLMLLIILFITIRKSIMTKDFVSFSFTVLMISLFLTESFLSRQRGIIFFIMMYSLINAKDVNSITSLKNKE